MQKIKAVRLKYDFLVGKIIKTARSVVMKLIKNPYQEICEKTILEKCLLQMCQPAITL